MEGIDFQCFSCGSKIAFKKFGSVITCSKCRERFVISKCNISKKDLVDGCYTYLSCSRRDDCTNVSIKIRVRKINIHCRTLEEANRLKNGISDFYNGRLLIFIQKGVDGRCSDCPFLTGSGFLVETFRKKKSKNAEFLVGVRGRKL